MCHSDLHSKYFHIENPKKVIQPNDLLVVSKKSIKELDWEYRRILEDDYKGWILYNLTVYTIPLGEGKRLFEYYNKELYPKQESKRFPLLSLPRGRCEGSAGHLDVDCDYFTDKANFCISEY